MMSSVSRRSHFSLLNQFELKHLVLFRLAKPHLSMHALLFLHLPADLNLKKATSLQRYLATQTYRTQVNGSEIDVCKKCRT